MPPRRESKLFSLLRDSPFEPPILELAEACEQILRDNKMPFFPAYTDHGYAHIEAVLDASEQLIPPSVWTDGLLEPADAAVLIGATYLHDLGMHLRENGFLELISPSTRYEPLPWFDLDQNGSPADRGWSELWEVYLKEARHFTKSQLDRILGQIAGRPPVIFTDPEASPATWGEGDRLLIGEFIRRHHSRLSHEIAIRGFPGLLPDDFPVLQDSLPQLADAIGVTARSHNMDLRQAHEYLDYREPGNKRPDGAVQLYLMAILRTADYFQLGLQRASSLLLHLRQPQSPQSVDEWRKNQAITSISWKNDDPLAVYVQVSPTHNLRTHLQLKELIGDLQRELDISTAVLSESFGRTDLKELALSRQRVRTNLDLPSLHHRLDFVPLRARLRSDEDLFRLVISDLYGNEPAVAGRELLQNAVDAVRERLRWQDVHKDGKAPSDLRDLPADVLVEIVETGEGSSFLRIADRGIGMTPETVIEIFLTAGATLGNPRKDNESLDSATAIKWMKAGRFGVGVFAAFLLGSTVSVTTRHVSEARGVSFTATLDDDLVQLDWADGVPIGTEIVVPFSAARLPRRSYVSPIEREMSALQKIEAQNLHLLEQIAAYYELVKPAVRYRRVNHNGDVSEVDPTEEVPTPGGRLPDAWRSIQAADFDAVLWKTSPVGERGHYPGAIRRKGRLTHNGIAIRKPDLRGYRAYRWAHGKNAEGVLPPRIAVFDSRQLLGVSLNRYELTEETVPFEERLIDSIGLDIVAHSLVYGEERRHPLAEGWGLLPIASHKGWLPLLPQLVQCYVDRDLYVLWSDSPRWQQNRGRFHDRSQFLAPRGSPVDWRRLPFRAVLTPDDGPSDPRSEAERDYWGIALEDVSRSIDQLANRLERTPVAGVFLREAGDPRFRDHLPPPPALRGAGFELDRSSSTKLPLRSSDDQLVEDLARIGAKILDGPYPGAIGLTVFRRKEISDDHFEGALSLPWLKKIGGPLERSRKQRLLRKSALIEGDRKLRALVHKWERMSA